MEDKDIVKGSSKVNSQDNISSEITSPDENNVSVIEPTTENTNRLITLSKKVKIKLSKPIINNRISYDAGDTLEVKESTANYLEAGDYGKRV